MTADASLPPGAESDPSPGPTRRRLLVFVAVAVTGVAVAAGYALHRVGQERAALAAAKPIAFVPIAALPAHPRPALLFRSTALGGSYGRVSLASAGEPGAVRQVSPLECDRVHYAAGVGLCLQSRRGVLTTYHAHLFDDTLALRHSYTLAGPPSRARLSPDGRRAAFTVFVNGHSYAGLDFTTRTSIVDARSGAVLVEDLEALPVQRDGAAFKDVDFNFWGVSFAADGRRFYATLGTGGKTYLLEGDLAALQMRVVHDDVECPSLSPDGARVAFKRRKAPDGSGRVAWRLVVLELATGRETALDAETRSVDDQVEWLGKREIVYALPRDGVQATVETDLWALAADGTSAPRLLMPSAFSPAAIPGPQ